MAINDVRSEHLSGEHSFRGVGYLLIGGFTTFVCGSKLFDFGLGSSVVYYPCQLSRVGREVEYNCTFAGMFEQSAVTGFLYRGISSMKTRPILFGGFVDGLWGGLGYRAKGSDFVFTFPPECVMIYMGDLSDYTISLPNNSITLGISDLGAAAPIMLSAR